MKIAVIGAGSTYTPELVEGIVRLRESLPVTELVLHDTSRTRLDVVGSAAVRILRAQGWDGEAWVTTDLDRAVDSATAVLLQIRVGGQAARHLDETIPLACGCIGQETTGAGGFSKALRTVPVILDIAQRVRERAGEEAWIIDFTNPVGIVTRALLDAGHRAVGLCNVAIGFQRLFAQWLHVPADHVRLGHAGLNHLTWIRSVSVHGEDALPDCSRPAARSWPTTSSCHVGCSPFSERCRRTTCATSTCTTRCSRSCAPLRPAPTRCARSRRSCSPCTLIPRSNAALSY